MKKIRVLHCIETVASGGVEQLRLSIFKFLDKNKFEHRLVCTSIGGELPDQIREAGVIIHQVGPFLHPFQFRKHYKVRQIIREFKPQIIHGAVFEGNTMAFFGSIFTCVPVTILEETSDPQNRSWKANAFLYFISSQAQKVIAISESVRTYLTEQAGIKGSKTITIPNGVHVDRIITNSEEIKLKYFHSNELIIGFVGRIRDDHKRVSDLVQAVKQLNHPNIKLLIVGNGPDRLFIEDLVKSEGLEFQTLFVGYQGNTSAFYSIMDILCVPSAREGFGLVAVEGMLHKLPVVATSVGGLKEIVIDGTTGFLVPPKSPEYLAEKLQKLIHDPAIRKQFGEAGYQRAMTHYTAERYCRDIEKLYLDLLAEKGIVV